MIEELIPPPDPVECCARLEGLPYRLFLDSAAQGSLGRYSFLMADPASIVRGKETRTEHVDRVRGASLVVDQNALDLVRSLLAPHSVPSVAGLPPFQGGAAGYIGYD